MNNNDIKELELKKIVSQNGIDIYKIEASKFKTNIINIFFKDELNRENAAKNALMSSVLKRGTKKLPSTKELSIYLEELYGTVFDCGVSKRGEMQFVQFYLEFILDDYADNKESVFEKSFDFVYDIIFNPKIENDSFDKEYVMQEINNCKNLIESRINDKQSYAYDRCIEEMCKNENYGVFSYGNIEDYETINEKNLYEHYTQFIKTSPISIFISGDVDEAKIIDVTKKIFEIKREKIKTFEKSDINIAVNKEKEIVEKMLVNQGKFSMGFRTYVDPKSDEYYALIMCNSILGGGIHSKLFQNVREKEGLAYYAFSRLEKHKGIMVLSSGIDIDKKQRVKEIMLEQIEDIQNGNISEYEYEVSQKVIESSLNSVNDSQMQMVDFYLTQLTLDTNETLQSVIDKCKKVTKEDIIKVSKKLKLDTVYFLTKS